MADLRRTIEIIFGTTDNASSGIEDIDNTIGGLAGTINASTQPLADLASSVLKVETGLTALGGAILIYTNGAAADMGDAQAGLNKVLGESEGSAKDYEDAIKDLSLQFGVLGTDTVSTVADFKQAGFSIEEALTLVETALTAVNIAELSAEESGDLLIKNIKGIGAEADQAGVFLDAWNAISNTYNATVRELATGTAALGPSAKAAGLSFNELIGLLTPVIEVIGSGSEAANTLKVGLANLIDVNPRVTKTLAELGIAQTDVNGALRLSGEILNDLGGVWSTLSDSQQANFGIQLFGKEQYVKMSIVLNEHAKVLKITEEANNSFGSSNDELLVALNKASLAVAQLATAFNFAAIAIGDKFLLESAAVTKSLTALTTSFGEVVKNDGLKPLFDLLNPLLTEFSNNINIIAKNLPEAFKGIDFTKLVESFQAIGFEVGDLFDVDLKTVEGLQDTIQSIVDGLGSLNLVFAGIIEGFAPVIELFQSLAEESGEADSSTATFIGNIIGYGATVNVFSGWLSDLTDVMGNVAEAVLVLVAANRLGLLPASFGAAGVAAGTLTKAIGKAGLLGAVGLVSFEFGKMIGELPHVKGAFTLLFETIDKANNGPLSKADELLKDFNTTITSVVEPAKEHAAAVIEMQDAHVKAFEEATKFDDVVNDLAESTEDATKTNSDMEAGQVRLNEQLKEMGLNVQGTTIELRKEGQAVKVTSGEYEGWYSVLKDGAEVFFKTKSAAEGAAQGIDKTRQAEKDLAAEAEAAKEAAKELILEFAKLEVEMESIASNERIKNIEFFVELETEKIQADAEKVVAALETVSASYISTNELVAELYGLIGGDNLSRLQEIDIERAAADAEKRATEQWETQKKLIEAQIEQIEASTERSKRGDALITVDGGDLQPELQAIMESLFKSIRIQMSAEYEDFLLGLQQ